MAHCIEYLAVPAVFRKANNFCFPVLLEAKPCDELFFNLSNCFLTNCPSDEKSSNTCLSHHKYDSDDICRLTDILGWRLNREAGIGDFKSAKDLHDLGISDETCDGLAEISLVLNAEEELVILIYFLLVISNTKSDELTLIIRNKLNQIEVSEKNLANIWELLLEL